VPARPAASRIASRDIPLTSGLEESELPVFQIEASPMLGPYTRRLCLNVQTVVNRVQS
jgi:hypothetical protein